MVNLTQAGKMMVALCHPADLELKSLPEAAFRITSVQFLSVIFH